MGGHKQPSREVIGIIIDESPHLARPYATEFGLMVHEKIARAIMAMDNDPGMIVVVVGPEPFQAPEKPRLIELIPHEIQGEILFIKDEKPWKRDQFRTHGGPRKHGHKRKKGGRKH